MAVSAVRRAVEKELYSVNEVATILGVDHVSVRRWIIGGQLPSLKIFGARKIRKDVVDALLHPTCSVQPRVGDWSTADEFVALLRPDQTR